MDDMGGDINLMRKLLWTIILLIALAIAIPLIYILVPGAQQPIAGFFGGVTPLFVSFFQNANAFLLSLPTGTWTILIVGLFIGVLLDRYAHSLWFGMRRRMVFSTYQDAGFAPMANVAGSGSMVAPTTSQPQSTIVQSPPPMTLKEEE